MNSKLPIFIFVLCSALLLSACGAKKSDTTTTTQDQVQTGQPISGDPGQRPQIDYAAAAEKLNITEKVLKEALGVTDDSDTASGPAKIDLTTAAKKLNITVEELKTALGVGAGPQGNPPSGTPSGTPPQN